MRLADMHRQPGYLIRRAHQMATAVFMARARELDLTTVQFSTLLAILNHPTLDATRLSELVSVDRATIGHVLTRLEEKGLISRRPGRDDRRTKTLSVTEQGAAALRRIAAIVPDINEDILARLSATERTTLLALLEKLTEGAVLEAADIEGGWQRAG